MMDSDTGRSKGYGFITVRHRPGDTAEGPGSPDLDLTPPPSQFADAECAKKALEQLNGFELAGRPMKVGHVTERGDSSGAAAFLEGEDLDLNPGRLQLMAQLTEGEQVELGVLASACPPGRRGNRANWTQRAGPLIRGTA